MPSRWDDGYWFDIARKHFASHSTCGKAKIGAVLVKNGMLLAGGWNMCAPRGEVVYYGVSLAECPRSHMPSLTSYELCGPIHAEIMACLNYRPHLLWRAQRPNEEIAIFASHLELRREDIFATFDPKELEKLSNATVYITGHHLVCDGCKKFLGILGISDIRCDPKGKKPAPASLPAALPVSKSV